VKHSEGRFPGADGLELYYQLWQPESEPRAVIALVHGVGEHCGRYMNVVGPLVDAGYAVYGFDQRGHGSSPGPRVHIDRWREYREDLGAYLGMIADQLPGPPLVLYGHSMGSLVVLDYLMQNTQGIAGAIISGAAIEPVGVGSASLVLIARVLSGVLPKYYVDLGIDPNSLSRDPEALEAYRADPLVAPKATVRWGTESLDTVRRVKEGMCAIDVPILVLHGEADPLNLVEGARTLFDSVASDRKTIHVYPDVCHEPHNDLGHEQVATDVAEWLAQLTNGSDASARPTANDSH